jgi:hypothetical protein
MVCRGGEENKFLHLSVIELRKYSVQASYSTDRAIQVISDDIGNINEDAEEHEIKQSWLILFLKEPRIKLFWHCRANRFATQSKGDQIIQGIS